MEDEQAKGGRRQLEPLTIHEKHCNEIAVVDEL